MEPQKEFNAADLLSLMPWYWCVAHWLVTVMVMIPMVLALLVAQVAVWWNYSWADRMSDRATKYAHNTRWWIMHRAYEKYGLFLMLKQTG